MTILAVDCCFDSCSAALFDGTRFLASAFETMQRGQAERLTSMVAEVLAAGGQTEISRVAVTTGPGTFTGVRIGLSFARAFALGCGVPCIGINSLAAVALAGDTTGIRVGVHGAPQGIYMEAFDKGVSLAAPGLFTLEAAAAALPSSDLILAGTGAVALMEYLGSRAKVSGPSMPDAKDVARFAYNLPPDLHLPNPLYLRAPDVRPPKGLGLARKAAS